MSPLYVYGCEACETEVEIIQPIGADEPNCCGTAMTKKPTAHAFVVMNGPPSFRKHHLGTAPFTGRVTGLEGKGGPGSQMPDAKSRGAAWLESIA